MTIIDLQSIFNYRRPILGSLLCIPSKARRTLLSLCTLFTQTTNERPVSSASKISLFHEPNVVSMFLMRFQTLWVEHNMVAGSIDNEQKLSSCWVPFTINMQNDQFFLLGQCHHIPREDQACMIRLRVGVGCWYLRPSFGLTFIGLKNDERDCRICREPYYKEYWCWKET